MAYQVTAAHQHVKTPALGSLALADFRSLAPMSAAYNSQHIIDHLAAQ
jgi:hypothetical protein